MTLVVSVFNHKGGVGKTTVTANLGAELARRGRRVLLVDVDPQASLTMTFVWPELWHSHMVEPRRTIAELLLGETPHADKVGEVLVTPENVAEELDEVGGTGSLDLVASSPLLRDVDLELAHLLSAPNKRQLAQKHAAVFLRLAKALDGTNHDVVLIDCPPAFSVVTRMALFASHHVLVPTRPDYLSTASIDRMLHDLNDLIDTHNATVAIGRWPLAGRATTRLLGVVFTMVTTYGGKPIQSMQTFTDNVRSLGYPTFESFITTQNTHYGDAAGSGVPIALSTAAKHRETVGQIRALTTEFLRRVGESA